MVIIILRNWNQVIYIQYNFDSKYGGKSTLVNRETLYVKYSD